jgi:hypothetical protein
MTCDRGSNYITSLHFRIIRVSPLSLNYFLQLSARIHHCWKTLRPEKLLSKSVLFRGSPFRAIWECLAVEEKTKNPVTFRSTLTLLICARVELNLPPPSNTHKRHVNLGKVITDFRLRVVDHKRFPSSPSLPAALWTAASGSLMLRYVGSCGVWGSVVVKALRC